ncbi:MAG: VanZ family protein [Anaerolineae bacterium]|nr:VanZ family protein [Anaerolineae bacterium]MCX8066646.1 VanZ family protein [Anaerolineae bacterium]MDW7992533.1 VanZ family protein [Anaerolineae bacterium]
MGRVLSEVSGAFRAYPILRWIPALFWMGLIFFLSAQPDLPHAPQPWLDIVLKKTGHAVLYGILARLYLWALEGRPLSLSRPRLLALLLVLLYGASDEVHQAFVPGRTPSLWDVLIDGIGGGLALFVRGIESGNSGADRAFDASTRTLTER